LQYKAQNRSGDLCSKSIDYLKHTMEILSDLENANVLERIYLVYEHKILEEIGKNNKAGQAFYKALNTWENSLPSILALKP
jgi:hypothetical protein